MSSVLHHSTFHNTNIPFVDKNAQRTTGNKAQMSNIEAAKVMSDVIKTCLGPKAMLKMVIDQMGSIVVTSDGNAVLRELDVAHPAAKSMLEVCRTQDEEVGDGTTSVVVLAGEFLAAAAPLLERKIHPTVIINGYRKALECALKSLSAISVPVDVEDEAKVKSYVKVTLGTKLLGRQTDMIVDLAVQAVKTVTMKKPDARTGMRTEIDIKRYAKVEKIPGGDVADSFVLDGTQYLHIFMYTTLCTL